MFCYTSDLQLATAWPQCIHDQAAAAIAQLNQTNSTLVANQSVGDYSGKCEYVDYDRLKGGLKALGSGAAGARVWGVERIVIGSLVVVVLVQLLAF